MDGQGDMSLVLYTNGFLIESIEDTIYSDMQVI